MSAYEKLFSETAKTLRPSPIREILSVIRQPGMISFAGGMPDPLNFPVDQFYEAAQILKTQGRDVLQYGATEGYAPLVEFMRAWTAPRMGRTPNADEMLITSGSSQVSDLLCWSLIDPGDTVIMEEPTFMGMFLNMHNHGAQFITVPCDAEGMQVDLLPEKIETARNAGKKIKFIYTIPNFHNPLGCTLSPSRREKLVEIAHRYEILLFEDDPYGYVRFDGDHEPSIYSIDAKSNQPGWVLYSGSFSKILAPGTRVGWCTGPKEVIRKMAVFKQGVDVTTSGVAQALVYEYCRLGHLDAFLPQIIAHYKTKRDDMEAAMQKHLPKGEASWIKPAGGYFYWVTLQKTLTRTLFDKAIEKKVAFVLGEAFYPNQDGGKHAMRLCYTFATPEQTEEGISRLGQAIKELI